MKTAVHFANYGNIDLRQEILRPPVTINRGDRLPTLRLVDKQPPEQHLADLINLIGSVQDFLFTISECKFSDKDLENLGQNLDREIRRVRHDILISHYIDQPPLTPAQWDQAISGASEVAFDSKRFLPNLSLIIYRKAFDAARMSIAASHIGDGSQTNTFSAEQYLPSAIKNTASLAALSAKQEGAPTGVDPEALSPYFLKWLRLICFGQPSNLVPPFERIIKGGVSQILHKRWPESTIIPGITEEWCASVFAAYDQAPPKPAAHAKLHEPPYEPFPQLDLGSLHRRSNANGRTPIIHLFHSVQRLLHTYPLNTKFSALMAFREALHNL